MVAGDPRQLLRSEVVNVDIGAAGVERPRRARDPPGRLGLRTRFAVGGSAATAPPTPSARTMTVSERIGRGKHTRAVPRVPPLGRPARADAATTGTPDDWDVSSSLLP